MPTDHRGRVTTEPFFVVHCLTCAATEQLTVKHGDLIQAAHTFRKMGWYRGNHNWYCPSCASTLT